MSTTLVGMFDSEAQARQACERLRSAGIGEQSMRIENQPVDTGSTVESHEKRGFFARLFGIGDDDETSTHYDEALRRGHAMLTVTLHGEERIEEISDILEDCGAVDVDERVQEWKASGYTPASIKSPTPTPTPMPPTELHGESQKSDQTMRDDSGDRTLQAVEEELKVGKRVVQRGSVRIYTTVDERPVEEQVSLRDEEASIERQKVDRPASDAELESAFRDQDIEIRETSEEPVVEKTARVVEEVRVGKKQSQRSETVRDTVRSSRINVDDDTDDIGDIDDVDDVEAADLEPMPRYMGPERRLHPGGEFPGTERRAGY